MTVKEIAKLAGVSTGTVSRYLTGCKLKETNAFTLKRIIAESGYRVNYSARALRNKKTYTVGIAVYRFEGEYSGAIADAASDVLDQSGYLLLVCSYHGDGSVQDEKMQRMKERFIDGLIYYPSGHDVTFLQDFAESGIPIVAVNEDVNFDRCDKVRYDGFAPFYEVTKKCIVLGHKRIAILGGISFGRYSKENTEGYFAAMREAGLQNYESQVYTDYDYDKARDAAARLLDARGTTAIIAVNDIVLQAVLDAVDKLGLRIPEDISVVGCYSTRHYRDSRVSYLKVNGEDVGKTAAELLVLRIREPNRPFEVRKLPMSFWDRHSIKDLRGEQI